MTPRGSSGSAVSRRHLLHASVAGAALLPLASIDLTGVSARRNPQATDFSYPPSGDAEPPRWQVDASPATWRTWILTSSDELRPAPPEDPTQVEIDELLQLQTERDEATIALIQHWNNRPAVLVWTELANAAYPEFTLNALRQYRANALLQTAMSDAVLASYDAQDTYAAPLSATLDGQITPLAGIVASRPTFPSEHAAVAGAAAAVLTALLPDAAPGRFAALAEEAASTRLQAGLNTRRDIDAGFALGQAIGERAIALAADDQPGSAWDGSSRLEGPGYWEPTPPAFADPLEPLAGTWHRWVLEAADQFRPAPPSSFDSLAWHSQLAAVQEAVAQRSLMQAEKARYWQNSAASTLWDHYASELITHYGLELPHAARVLAATAVAVADAGVATWDGKYAYGTARPITADPDLDVLFATPPFPSYPAAHATASSAAAVVLAHFFPDNAADLLDLSEEAAASRVWAGIHFPMDCDAGIALGRQVGYLVADVARQDGAE